MVSCATAIVAHLSPAKSNQPPAGTQIIGLTPHVGADSIEGNFESDLAAIAVMDWVMRYDQPFDAVIQAGYGEHGREGLQELLDVPVVDITDADASTAMFLGHAHSVVTTLDRTVPLIEDRLKLSGLWDRCASVRASGLAVLELEQDPERALFAIVQHAGARRQGRSHLPGLRRHGRAGRTDPTAHRRAGGGRRDSSGDHR
ncbi:allantoin racemase [Pseudomonas sp. ok272]|nr:allantoin racemase [Pseudomonas sp. ok272]SFN34562.1 allantoin racemase [Pseudomonas sp. ok602]